MQARASRTGWSTGRDTLRPTRRCRAHVLALLATSLAFPACATVKPATPARAQVLDGFLDAWWAQLSAEDAEGRLLLEAETKHGLDWTSARWTSRRKSLIRNLAGLREDTLADYERANARKADLRGVVRKRPWLSFVPPEEVKAAFFHGRTSRDTDAGYRKILGARPGARQLRTVSWPGVSKDGSQALVYATEGRWARVAAGYYFLLALEDGEWRIVARCTAWMS